MYMYMIIINHSSSIISASLLIHVHIFMYYWFSETAILLANMQYADSVACIQSESDTVC